MVELRLFVKSMAEIRDEMEVAVTADSAEMGNAHVKSEMVK